MKSTLLAFVAGFIFSIGLGVSGMTQPQKVLAFLNLAGSWSPALILVMGAAVAVSAFSYLITRKWQKPVLTDSFSIPAGGPITPSLIIGAILFGIGWGVAGYCPGPALVSFVTLRTQIVIFVCSMIVGMLAFKAFDLNWSSK